MPQAANEATAELVDDFVLPFTTVNSGMVGRVVRLGTVANTILGRHDHPERVSEALGQALALTAMLGSALKFTGNLILQTQTDGPLSMLVASYESPGRLRGYAGFNPEELNTLDKLQDKATPLQLTGRGQLALTIDPGKSMERYQGIVSMDEGGLTEAALNYFRQSEQLPTFVRLAVARHRVGTPTAESEGGAPAEGWQWRAGGILIQHVSPIGGKPRDLADGREIEGSIIGEADDDWRRVEMLASTVEDHELLDPTLSAERLLYRLFHEEGVRVTPGIPLDEYCRCSRDRVASFLQTFKGDNISDLRDAEGKVTITCEFCSTSYQFDPDAGEH